MDHFDYAYARISCLEKIVAAFCRHFDAGDIVMAEGVDEWAAAAFRGFHEAAIIAMAPPNSMPADENQADSVGASE